MITPPFLIGISGGSGSGKTTIATELYKKLAPNSAFISEDNYYKDTNHMIGFDEINFDFDDPIIRDHELLVEDLLNYKNGQNINHPIYDFTNHCRMKTTQAVKSAKFLILEGTHLFHNQKLRDLFNLKIFIHTDEELRFKRRLERDIAERGRTAESVYQQYEASVRPGHYKWTEPTRHFADLILDCNGDNSFPSSNSINENIDAIMKFLELEM